ncbi:NAD-dependent epimerase/dehydratase [Desulfarculus baarsii DSM 2075]|uniref:NAD-dependent epimerase/dehydratase n=1 Tax=Desulfarculus baarsii (strain ATCC 33931 / DSM 2075 / LMG 7858 / VKM B-1802 / 2st14) TaxID=644282 RepID=E1QG12_DESB2|nr:DUF2867 domain-containing protein [Desulfarculus baarsii]ADK84622.1 NAD-dependent epimerase/dehydratase [Desulfarculus baarsii DSM 2075]
MDDRPVFVTGATGYVGGRLVPRLLASGRRVRAVGRSLEKLACRPWAGHPLVELVKADAMDVASMARAMKGCGAAYYLVHSMNPATADFAKADLQAALNMAAAAEHAGLSRIIYLGGLVPEGPGISHHLASRAQVARALQAGATPVTWLRAAMLLGSGSASFELMRYLVDRLPVMLTPKWVRTKVQPIAIANALGYLEACLDNPDTIGQAFDIGGPEVLTYEDLFRIYAEEAGLRRRWIIPLPFLNVRLSSYWIHLITPVPAALAQPLAEGLSNEVVMHDQRIRQVAPQELIDCRQAIRRALQRIEQQKVETCWHDAGHVLPPEWVYCADASFAGGTILQAALRSRLAAPAHAVWPAVTSLGGEIGWRHAQFLWALRGWLDELVGGVGLRRGRRHPRELGVGDALDFWRVLEVEKDRRLLLLAEMKLPGQAVLEIQLEPLGPDMCELRVIARFLPRGLAGLAYWWAALPLHGYVFKGMASALAKASGAPLLSGPAPFDPTEALSCRLRPGAQG